MKEMAAIFSVQKRRRLEDDDDENFEDVTPKKKIKDDGMMNEIECDVLNEMKMSETFKFGSKANLLGTEKNVEWGIEQDQMKQPAPSMLGKF